MFTYLLECQLCRESFECDDAVIFDSVCTKYENNIVIGHEVVCKTCQEYLDFYNKLGFNLKKFDTNTPVIETIDLNCSIVLPKPIENIKIN